jgi:N-acetylmuramoyl-L-alanine amidase
MEVAMLENSVIKLEEDYETKYEGFDPNSVDSYIMFEFMKDQYTDRSITCADFIQTRMINASKRNDRGVRQAGFLVLRATAMPSVLVELGFISNKDEEKYLNNNDNQVKLATAIFNGIKEYKHELDKKSGTVNSEELGVRSEELNKTITEPNKQLNDSTNNQITESPNLQLDIEFYIQYLVSKNNYSADNAVFKGHAPTKILNENNLYKYLIGPFDVNTALNKRKEITKNFPDAFIVAYKEGKKVSTPEAIEEAKEKLK